MGSKSQGMSFNARSVQTRGTEENQPIELRRVGCFVTEPIWKRILRRVFPDQRKQERLPAPPLVAYLGTQAGSRSYELGDISLTGFCLLTDEHWMPGTEMPVTLQATNLPEKKGRECFTVQATVVRCGSSGLAFSIVLCEEDSQAMNGNPIHVQWVGRAEMEIYLDRLKEDPDAALLRGKGEVPAESGTGRTAALKAAFESGR